MTAYVKCAECGGEVPWYYAWVWHPTIAMHPGCALERWDAEGSGAMGPAIRDAIATDRDLRVLSAKAEKPSPLPLPSGQ